MIKYTNIVYWPCEYCNKKFIDVRSVINHEKNCKSKI